MNQRSSKTILLVEDQVVVATVEKSVLEGQGYKVIIANNGEDAVQIATNGQELDLVLMDIDLGEGIDGSEAARRILNQRETPVLFLSSHTEAEIVKRTEGINSYGYIVKNSGDNVMLASVRMALRLHSAYQELQEKQDKLKQLLEEQKRAEKELKGSEKKLQQLNQVKDLTEKFVLNQLSSGK